MTAYIVRVDEIVIVVAKHDLALGYSYKVRVCSYALSTRCLRVWGGKNCEQRESETKRVESGGHVGACFVVRPWLLNLRQTILRRKLTLHNGLHFSFRENTVWLCYQRLGVTP